MQPPPFVPPKPWLTFFTVLIAAFVYDALFYDKHIGLNLSIFSVLVIGALMVRYRFVGLSIPARVTMLGTLLAAAMVCVHHSGLAMTMTVISLVTTTALAHEKRLRSLPFAMPQVIANYLALPLAGWEGAGGFMRQRPSTRTGWRWGRLAALPVIIAIVFFQLYRIGNPKFETLTAGFLDGLWNALGDLLEFLFTRHLFFFLFAMFVCGGLLYRFAPQVVVQVEEGMKDALVRVRSKRPHWLAPRAMDPLERERRMGTLLLIIVNALLVIVNVIDIDWVWFNFEVPENFSLKQFVHEGTWILIASILLSMLVLLHLFRRNQNFYARSVWLKRLALLWVGQNLVLCISVFLRNYHYIAYHGLAYKRIGVIAFVVLVTVGLITLYIKINQRRSLFYLTRVNAWACFVLLIGMCTVDWDSFIVRTNLRHANPAEIDIDNYLHMGDGVLPLLYANVDLVEKQMEMHKANTIRWVETLEPQVFRYELDAKRDRFLDRMGEQDWKESNLADAETLRALNRMQISPKP